MPAAAKSQSQDSAKSRTRTAVCFRALAYKVGDRAVDGIHNKILRFELDKGQAVEISISDVCARALALDLYPAHPAGPGPIRGEYPSIEYGTEGAR